MLKNCIVIILIIISSCENPDNRFSGGWVVDNAFIHGELALWNMYGNGIDLDSDHTCVLPISDWEHRHTNKETGIWKTYKKKNKYFLEIKTENEIFNRTFEIKNVRKVRDSVSLGFLMKMSLFADSVQFDCTKAIISY